MHFEQNIGCLTEPVSGRHWNRAETQKQVLRRVHALLSAGVGPGDRVLILFGNRLEFFAELLAAWRLGACAIPVDARLTPFEVEKLASAAQAKVSVFDDTPDPARLGAVSGTRVLDTRENPECGDDVPWSTLPRLDDDALILFTSGSTGQPKGVVHTHRSLLARWQSLRENIGLDRYRRTLCVLPTHFGHGLICNCLFPWLNGCDLFITPPFQTELVMRLGVLIDEHGISFMSSVPSVWNLALKTAAPPGKGSLERIHIGSAPLSRDLWTRVQEWGGCEEVFNTYGITETGSWVAGTTGGPVVPESGLIGEPWGAVVRILSEGEPGAPGKDCQAGETGMVWLQTPALMKGYFQRQDLTDAAVHQGWFKTGDIGLLDDRGRLYLKGRERDEINKGGMKIFPADIDEIVEQFAAVSDVCSFGFDDEFYGENVGLAVVMNDSGQATLLGLYDWIKKHLAEHKHPARWYLLDEIPRTSRGKINRDSVRAACERLSPVNLRQLLTQRP
jgi:acyl-CoA synthetase (AMP-forming)/AMP-acid ligase II